MMKADDAFIRSCNKLVVAHADDQATLLRPHVALYLVHPVTRALAQVLTLAPSPGWKRARYAALLYNTEAATFDEALVDADVTAYVYHVRQGEMVAEG